MAKEIRMARMGVPNLGLGTAPFGAISSLQTAEDTGPRAIQLGGRLTF